eukprot:gene16135-biopygen13124
MRRHCAAGCGHAARWDVATLRVWMRRRWAGMSWHSALRSGYASYPGPFTIQRLQVFDERIELWVELLSGSQALCRCSSRQPAVGGCYPSESTLLGILNWTPTVPGFCF